MWKYFVAVFFTLHNVLFMSIFTDMQSTHSHTYIYDYTQWGQTALHGAVDQELEDTVEVLLEGNIDPDIQLNVSLVMKCTR